MQKFFNETGKLSNATERKWDDVASYYATEFSESVFFYIGLSKNTVLKVTNIYCFLKYFLFLSH